MNDQQEELGRKELSVIKNQHPGTGMDRLKKNYE
jgi:hypothetical protein